MSLETGSTEKDAAAYLKTWAARVEAETEAKAHVLKPGDSVTF